jgi:hypothetical protein
MYGQSSQAPKLPMWYILDVRPKTHAQAIEVEKTNRIARWQEAEETMMGQLLEYETFVDKE